MISDITFGQFFPSDSFVHKVDPRVKLLLTVLFIAAAVYCKDIFGICDSVCIFVGNYFFVKSPHKNDAEKPEAPAVYHHINGNSQRVFCQNGQCAGGMVDF